MLVQAEALSMVADSGLEVPALPSRNRGNVDRRAVFISLVEAVKGGYISLESIPHPKTRQAVETKLAKIGGLNLLAAAMGEKYYNPKGTSSNLVISTTNTEPKTLDF